MTGRTRFAVCRLFLHLAGSDVTAFRSLKSCGAAVLTPGRTRRNLRAFCNTMNITICRQRRDILGRRRSGRLFQQLVTDPAQRYLSEPDLSVPNSGFDQLCRYPVTRNVVVMMHGSF